MNRIDDIFARGRALFLAPMAGFSDCAFRALCKEEGADALVSEFVMANAVLEAPDSSRFWRTLDFDEAQRPFGAQLFGADPLLLAAAARRLADKVRPDFIDLNCGCPAPRIVDQCAGSALLKDLPRTAAILRAVVRAVPELPVTLKMRSGWDAGHIVAPELARIAQAEGAAMITLHARTREQGYGGDADWGLIGRVAASVKIPVVGNGLVRGVSAVQLLRSSGAAGLMVGRAALGRPWLFRALKAELAGEPPPAEPEAAKRLATMLRYAETLLGQGEDLPGIRARLKPFTEGIAGARQLRARMDAVASLGGLRELVGSVSLAP